MLKRTVTTFFIYVSIGFLCSGFTETTSGLNQKGNKHFEGKRYESALEAYRKAQVKNPDNPTIRYNLGTTLYQLDQFQEAQAQLNQALASANTKELKATAWYNYGNAEYRLGRLDKAIEAYRAALDLNPNDKDAKYNLELLQKKKSIFEIKQNKRDEERKNQPPPSQQQREQQGGGGRDQKQNQSPSQKDQRQDQGQEQNQQDQKEQQKEDQQERKSGREKSEKGLEEPEQNQGEQEQPMTPTELKPLEESQKPEEGEETEPPKPLLQGQMSQENALRILNALRESEQELQLLRQPRRQKEHEPLKDW